MSAFQEFPKIARLSRACVVTEKIDGTNAQVEIISGGDAAHAPGHYAKDDVIAEMVRDDNPLNNLLMFAGSRTRYITPAQDNHGFARWVQEHAVALWALGEGRHYGEWWGSGIQRGYALEKGEKRFSLFNVARWADARNREKYPVDRPVCCGVVPVLGEYEFSTTEIGVTMMGLVATGSMAAPGFMRPEGVVIFHSASGQLFKRTIEKDAEWKGASR